MKIKPKEVSKRVTLLTDPEPGWMALVSHGANQTPWNVIKSDSKEQTNMSKGKGATQETLITRLHFSKDQYPDEAAVQKFLDDNNIEDVVIVDESDIFAAKSTTAKDYELGEVKTNATKHPGVIAKIAVVIGKKGDASGEKTDDNTDGNVEGEQSQKVAAKVVHRLGSNKDGKQGAATRAKLVNGVPVTVTKDGDAADTTLRFPATMKKYDMWGAYMSNEGSLLGVLKDGIGYDGVPPGMDEVIGAVYYSAGNVLSGSEDDATKETLLKAIGEDFAVLAFGLYELFQKATEDATKSANTDIQESAKKFRDAFMSSVTRAAKGEMPKSSDNVITPDPKAQKHSVTVDIADANRTAEGEEDEDANTKAMRALFGQFTETVGKRLEGIEATVAAVETTTKSALGRSNQRRSLSDVDVNDLVVSNDEEVDEIAEEARENLRRSMGGRPKPRNKA